MSAVDLFDDIALVPERRAQFTEPE